MHGIVLLTVTSMMLIIIRGVAGTGKTTLAKQFKTPHHYEADMFMEATGGWEGRKLPMAHAWCTERVADALATKAEVVVVSNTFVKREHMEPYKQLASHHGYEVVEITLKKEYGSTKDIPEHTMERMRREFEV